MKVVSTLIIMVFLSYSVFVWQFLSKEPSRPILAIIENDSFPYIPTFVAKFYLSITNYSIVKESIHGASTYSSLFAAYDVKGFKNNEIIWLSNRFLENGVDINSRMGSSGYTPLQGAIMINAPELVRYLLKNGADKKILTQSKSAELCQGLTSIKFAHCMHSLGKMDFAEVIKVLENQI